MKTTWLILLFCPIVIISHAQLGPDSLAQHMSATSAQHNAIDSVGQNFRYLPDSLLPSLQKMDSIRQEFNTASDSIHKEYQSALAKIDVTTRQVNGKIDSLSRLDLPTEKYTAKLDSLTSAGQSIQSRLTSKLNALKGKTTEKIGALDLPPEYGGPVNDLSQKINVINLDQGMVKIPELQIPGFAGADTKGLTGLPSQISEIADVTNIGKLGDIGNGLPGQIQGYQNQIKDAVHVTFRR